MGRELVLVWGLGSRGWVEIEEGGLISVDGVEIAASREAIILGLLWFDGMIAGGCLAKGLDEVVVRGIVAGKHVGGRVKVGRRVTLCYGRHEKDDDEIDERGSIL